MRIRTLYSLFAARALPSLVLLLVALPGALHAGARSIVPDCLSLCGDTVSREVDTGRWVVTTRVTRSRSSMQAIAEAYGRWADRYEHVVTLPENQQSEGSMTLAIHPLADSEKVTVVHLRQRRRGGTEVSVTPPERRRSRRPEQKLPRLLPTCSGCTRGAVINEGGNLLVTLDGRGSAVYGMRRQRAAFRAAGWRAHGNAADLPFPPELVFERFEKNGAQCMARAGRTDKRNHFRLTLACSGEQFAGGD